MYYVTHARKYTQNPWQRSWWIVHLWPPPLCSAAVIHLLRVLLLLQNLPEAASCRQALKWDQPAQNCFPSSPVGKFLSHTPHIITHRNAGYTISGPGPKMKLRSNYRVTVQGRKREFYMTGKDKFLVVFRDHWHLVWLTNWADLKVTMFFAAENIIYMSFRVVQNSLIVHFFLVLVLCSWTYGNKNLTEHNRVCKECLMLILSSPTE